MRIGKKGDVQEVQFVMCKCFETAGDELDNTILVIFGHRPDCTEFHINKFEFCEKLKNEAQKIADKILTDEMKVKTDESKKHKTNRISEKNFQNALHRFCSDKNHSIVVPNVSMYWGEVDLLSVTRAGYLTEFEIKISRSDYKAEFRNKGWKHKTILQNPLTNSKKCPNYFYFVVPENLVKVEEVPDYAGLMFFREDKWFKFGTFDVVKKAPRLHSGKASIAQMDKLARSMMFRYWNYRLEREP